MSCNKDLYAKTAKFVFGTAQDIFADTEQAVERAPHTFLRDLFQADEANISETLLFQVLRATTPEQQWELLPFIRLPLVPAADIVKVFAPSDLFSQDDLMQVLAHQSDPHNCPLPAGHIAKKRRRTSNDDDIDSGSNRVGKQVELRTRRPDFVRFRHLMLRGP